MSHHADKKIPLNTAIAAMITAMIFIGHQAVEASQNVSAIANTVAHSNGPGQEPASNIVLIEQKPNGTILEGRLVTRVDAGDILLEESSGTFHHLLAEDVGVVEETDRPFVRFTPEETGRYLQQQMGAGTVRITEHFVICSQASNSYTDFCSQLLERVADQFPLALKRTGLTDVQISSGLSVMIFRDSSQLQAFAKQQHPDVDFTDTPGYYSVIHNQILFAADQDDQTARTRLDIARRLRKTPRVVETMVHETVHLLQYNSGLMNRFAANPTWIAEGMAVYFEPSRVRSSLVWSRPGEVNQLLLPLFKSAAQDDTFRLPLNDLFASDQAFSQAEAARDAYAESWAMTWMLMKYQPEAYGKLLKAQSQLKQLHPLTSDQRVKLVTEALEMDVTEMTDAVRKSLRRELVR